MTRWLLLSAAAMVTAPNVVGTGMQPRAPFWPRPHFHHIHMNSPNPSAAIAEFLTVYPASTKVTVAGFDGIKSANNVTMLFTKVNAPPPAPGPDRITKAAAQTAFWHHVWSAPNGRALLARLRERDPRFNGSRFIPQYTGPAGETVDFSSDTFSGFLTTAQVAAAARAAQTPTHRAGYFNWYGPDGVVMETADSGNGAEEYRIVGMFQEQPYCAVLWYERHLDAAGSPATGAGAAAGAGSPGAGAAPGIAAPTSEADCAVSRGSDVSWPSTYKRGHYRIPPAQSVYFDDVQLRWYMNQETSPLAGTRGQLMDHIAIGVTDLDRWIAKLRREHVKFLERVYRFGDARAVMIEGPSREALELVETK